MITNKVDIKVNDLLDLLRRNFVISEDEGGNDGKAFSLFFDQIAEKRGYLSLEDYGFGLVDHEYPDETVGDGEQTLVFRVHKYEYKNGWQDCTEYDGNFMIKGWYDSWDNGKTDGYWNYDIHKVVEREVTMSKWVVVE